jgi:D-tagatose-1,6-bisphosphate aldolase subunit GatZ/KbaZ
MELSVTTVQDAQESIQTFYDQFKKLGLEEAWQRVIALVVQPGVEFDHAHIIEYDRQKAASLSAFIKAQAGLVFEAHSTDYQLPIKLKQLVEDQFAILKVGPGLTFALREALFALAEIENIWLQQVSGLQKSDLMNIIEQVMLENPKEWRPYYHGTETEQAFARKYSYSDRIRYYWNDPTITKAVDTLIDNLESAPPPLPLISQFLPIAYQHIREGKIKNQPKEIIWDHIQGVIQTYQQACKP